ncbi:hypothetical protein TNCV_1392951 [Trichonephila clavipes]|nr:hypothetical protein TNCV_1392951 [Trichonephila clavipes]
MSPAEHLAELFRAPAGRPVPCVNQHPSLRDRIFPEGTFRTIYASLTKPYTYPAVAHVETQDPFLTLRET